MTFFKGLLIGFSIAAPVGPIGVLCIRRAMLEGRLAGFVSGLGAATADAVYGVVAVLGLTAITSVLLEQRTWLQLGGGAFLVCLGLTKLRAGPPLEIAGSNVPAPNLGAAFVSTLALTLTNPMTILSFVGIFAGVGIGTSDRDTASGTLLVTGVFLGSASWWLLLSFTAGWLGARLQPGGLRLLHVFSGLTIAVFGVGQLVAVRFAH
jgi:threonine/homoserine/homoserine lactone efflux protein